MKNVALFLGLLLLFSCRVVCRGQERKDLCDLSAGQAVPILLTEGHAATLRLDISNSESGMILLDAAVPGISYQIAASDGTQIVSGAVGTFGWTAIPFRLAEVARSSCDIWIRLKTEIGAKGLAGVRIRAELRSMPLKALAESRRAAVLFNSAQRLHRSMQVEDLRRAIEQFDQAAADWARAGDPYGQALALGGKGESEVELSLYGNAKRTLDRALALAGNDAYLSGWLLHLAARVLLDQWRGQQARAYVEQEMRLGEEIGDTALIALARSDLACLAFWLRDPKMGEIAEQAHAEAIAAGAPETLALEQYWKGWIEEYDERDVSAMSVLNESEANFRLAGDPRNAWVAVQDLAQTLSDKGDFYSALAAFSKLDKVFKATGNLAEYETNLICIGQQYERLNQPRLAEMYYRRADVAFARAHILFGRIVSHRELCETEISSSETEKAVEDCKFSLALARQFDDAAFLGQALYEFGLAERNAGNATQALTDFREAIKVTHTINDPRYESKEHIQLGELLDLQGQHSDGLLELEQAKSLSQSVADPASLLEAEYVVARWYAQDGQYSRADTELAPALEKLEAARQLVSDNTLQASYFAAERKCYELAIELRMRQFDLEPEGDADALALELSERSRARSLLDALSARTNSGKRDNGQNEIRLMKAKLAVDRAFDRRLKLLVEGRTTHDLAASSVSLMQSLDNLERAEDDVDPIQDKSANSAQTISASDIKRASLNTGTTFFEYALSPEPGDPVSSRRNDLRRREHSYLWVIADGKLKSFVLRPRMELGRMVRQWRALASGQGHSGPVAGAKLRKLSAQLSCSLFHDAVQPEMKRLVIVPDGELAMLPFAALPEKGCTAPFGKPLIVEHEVTLTPSLSVYLSRKTEMTHAFHGEVAIVADPVFDAADPRAASLRIGATARRSHTSSVQEDTPVALPRLSNTGYEAKAIEETVRQALGSGQVFLAGGFDANLETILSAQMQGYRVWHLATHGIYDESMPEFSGLVFSLLERDGNPRFGFLKTHDIAQLNVPAELVVLSACDSAAGDNISGEGVMGLSYAFLRAGSKHVISTLWSVDDAKSRELMIAFYKKFLRNGRNAADALRQSQQAIMRQPNYSSPYYWAGFELTSVGQ